MAITFSPHCNYTSWNINTSGSSISISSVLFTDSSANQYTLWAGPIWPIQSSIDYLNANLQSYGLFSLNGNSIEAKLSENTIQSMVYVRNWVSSNVTFSQVGGSCVELPIYSEVLQAGGTNSITEENVKEWATIEIVIIAVMITILTITLLFKKI